MADKNDIVMINLDRPRMLWFGHKALKTLGAMTGKGLNELMDGMSNMDFEDIEKIYYCGLLKDAKINKEDLKLEDMEDLLDHISFMELPKYIQKAFGMSLGSGDEEETKNE